MDENQNIPAGLKILDDGRQHVDGLLPEWIFGPVDSRRYGRSLGINPIPLGEKVCSFNCPYCECGWTTRLRLGADSGLDWPSVAILEERLETALREIAAGNKPLGAITFAGNGEPTLHPEFEKLIGLTLTLRDRHTPQAKVVVLSNGTELGREPIYEALLRVDEACFKLDAVSNDAVRAVNLPHGKVSMEQIVDWYRTFPSPIVQTMFVRGTADNTGEVEIARWLDTLASLDPARVDLYSLDRPTPDPGLRRVPKEELEKIAKRARERLSVRVSVC